MLYRFLNNHVLANLVFVLVLILGLTAYTTLPRQQDPDINFNWIVITAIMPGASATDIEKRITDPLEDAIDDLSDIKFVSSNSRPGVSSLLLRFNQIEERDYDKRVSELRRKIQNLEAELPAAAESPQILEIVSANAYPVVTVIVKGNAHDEHLRQQAKQVIEDIERIPAIERVDNYGLLDPELQIRYQPQKLSQYGISAPQLADTIRVLFQDQASGNVRIGDEEVLIRLLGTSSDPEYLASMPILSAQGEIPLGELASVERSRAEATLVVSLDGTPSVLVAGMKKAGTNTLDLIAEVQAYIDERNALQHQTGVELVLVNDVSEITRSAISIMQNNALLGLMFVLLVTLSFLGWRMAIITTLGIPFILAGTFVSLMLIGETLNVSVLLAVVIALGMLVDDAVVVAESIYYRLEFGASKRDAVLESIKEVFAPVTTAVLTTMAAFMPLMLLPGILGDFMRVIPMVVTIALAISLIEAYWMLPAHALVMKHNFRHHSGERASFRIRFTRRLRTLYTRSLIKVLRYPFIALLMAVLLFISAVGALLVPNLIKIDFFASDTIRMFYVNIEMAPSTPLHDSLSMAEQTEQLLRQRLDQAEFRDMVSYAGLLFTETEPRLGTQYAQVLVGLNPRQDGMRSVEMIFDDIREEVTSQIGAKQISLLKLAGGPPVTKPITVKVRGSNYDEIRLAADEIKQALQAHEAIFDVSDDADRGGRQINLSLRAERLRELGLQPAQIQRQISMMADGEILTSFQNRGELTVVRLQSAAQTLNNADEWLQQTVPLPSGGQVTLGELVDVRIDEGLGNIRHYNFQRAITIEADIDKEQIDEIAANQVVKDLWAEQLHEKYPNLNLDFSGILDDIYESMNSMFKLFGLGIGIMYLILGTQFRSYFQPMMILVTVPLAFIGVILGVLISRQPLSLYTMYGIVALAGIAVNSAIVLISTANANLKRGMSLRHATVYAARRRVIPIIITTLTTIGGLFSLAAGLGGSSLLWGPVANAIVWGIGFSATLTLYVVPVLYRLFMRWSYLTQRH